MSSEKHLVKRIFRFIKETQNPCLLPFTKFHTRSKSWSFFIVWFFSKIFLSESYTDKRWCGERRLPSNPPQR